MSNVYLEKIAQILEQHEKVAGDKLRGVISPAWMNKSIAEKHNQKAHANWGQVLESHAGGEARKDLRSGVEGGIGAAIGAGAGNGAGYALSKKYSPSPKNLSRVRGTRVGTAIGAAVLGGIGTVHGMYKSVKNQEAEMHKKYSK